MKTELKEITIEDMYAVFEPQFPDKWLYFEFEDSFVDYCFILSGIGHSVSITTGKSNFVVPTANCPLTNQQATSIIRHFKQLGYNCMKNYVSRNCGWLISFKRG